MKKFYVEFVLIAMILLAYTGNNSYSQSLPSNNNTEPIQAAPAMPPINPPAPSDNKPEATKALTPDTEEYLKTGMQNYHEGKYDDAISSLARYASLSPEGKHLVTAFLAIGKSLEEMKRHKAALVVFGRTIELYPNSPETSLSIIAIADIGVAYPALRYPVCVRGAEYFNDPILAYDTALVSNVPVQITEHVRYQKGFFLWRTGRYKESYETCTALLKEFPSTSHRKEIIDILKADTISLIDQYFQSGDHIPAANLFLQAKKKGMIGIEEIDTMLKSALSFAHLGFYDVSSNIVSPLKAYAKAKTKSKNKTKAKTETETKASDDVDKIIAEIEKLKLASGQSSADTKWELFQSGRKYLSSKNVPLAEQTLAQLKSAGGEEFWSKISDYTLEDNKWTQKYRDYLGKN